VKKRKVIIIWCVIAILVAGNVFQLVWNNNRLFTDAVPDEQTALIIAETILKAMYGEDYLLGSSTQEYSYPARVLEASFNSFTSTWVVTGSLQQRPDHIAVGWVPEVVIRKHDGRIMSIRMI